MAAEETWRAPPPGLALAETAVHVWRVQLDVETVVVDRLARLLAADEAARAARFYFPRHRRRFTVARGALRTLLGHYLDRAPADIRFRYGEHGKPALASSRLQFNVSHAHELALIAVAWERMLGVDVEQVRVLEDAADIARSHFAPREFAAYMQVPPAQQPAAFFNCWTRKEAFIKAIGEGLSHPLHRFEVTLLPGEAARLVSIDGDPEAARRWKLMALHPHPGYAAALIAAGQDWTCVRYDGAGLVHAVSVG